MRVQFQCNYDDFREANLGRAGARLPRGRPLRTWRLVVGLLILIVMAAAGASHVALTRSLPAARPVPTTLPAGWALVSRFLYASAFSLAFCAACGALMAWTVLKRRPPAWLPAARTRRWMVVALVVVITIAAYLSVQVTITSSVTISSNGKASTARVNITEGSPDFGIHPSGYEMLLSVLPSLLILAIITAFTVTHRRLDLRRRWDGQPVLHRPYTLDASDAGITLEGPASTHRYQWDYFPGSRETLNLILLYISPYSFWIIPKRAFASAGDLEAFKAFLPTRVRAGTLLPAAPPGFPIQRLQPPPLPPKGRPALDMHNPPAS
jgi:hypothetical protein